jgi:hypothetical protein
MIVRKPPTAVYVLAILHLVGGGLGLLGVLANGALLAVNASKAAPAAPGRPVNPQDPGALQQHYADKVPAFHVYQACELALGLLLSALLLAGGVGLLKMRPWGRTLSLVYAPLSIATHLVALVYGLAFIIPATREFFELAAKQNPQLGPAVVAGEVGGYIGLFFGTVVIIYPIVVLVILLRPSIAAAFRGEYPPTPEEEEEEPWGSDRGRREERDEPPSEAYTR